MDKISEYINAIHAREPFLKKAVAARATERAAREQRDKAVSERREGAYADVRSWVEAEAAALAAQGDLDQAEQRVAKAAEALSRLAANLYP